MHTKTLQIHIGLVLTLLIFHRHHTLCTHS